MSNTPKSLSSAPKSSRDHLTASTTIEQELSRVAGGLTGTGKSIKIHF